MVVCDTVYVCNLVPNSEHTHITSNYLLLAHSQLIATKGRTLLKLLYPN